MKDIRTDKAGRAPVGGGINGPRTATVHRDRFDDLNFDRSERLAKKVRAEARVRVYKNGVRIK